MVIVVFAAFTMAALTCANMFMASTMTSCSGKTSSANDSDSVVVDSDSIAAVCEKAACDSLLCDSAAQPQIEVPASASASTVNTKPNIIPVSPEITGKDLDVDLGYAIYHGDMKNGLPDGQGRLTFKRSHKIMQEKDYVAAKGDVVEGVFRDGKIMTATWKKAAGGTQTISK